MILSTNEVRWVQRLKLRLPLVPSYRKPTLTAGHCPRFEDKPSHAVGQKYKPRSRSGNIDPCPIRIIGQRYDTVNAVSVHQVGHSPPFAADRPLAGAQLSFRPRSGRICWKGLENKGETLNDCGSGTAVIGARLTQEVECRPKSGQASASTVS
jgi:hypothetical protein